MTEEDINEVAPLIVKAGIRPRNTRLSKALDPPDGEVVFNVLQASSEKSLEPELLGNLGTGEKVMTTKGDYGEELKRLNSRLRKASEATRNELRREFLDYYQRFFQTGEPRLFNNPQRVWIKDKKPHVETFFGFNYKYRNLTGARAEFQSFVGTLDLEGSRELNALERHAQNYSATLPWVKNAKGSGKNGPFEMEVFQPPDFNAIHGMATHTTSF